MRFAKLMMALTAATCLTGCIASTTVIKLKKDGSGTIEQTTAMRPEAAAMLNSFASSMGKAGEGAAEKPPELFSDTQLRDAAAKLGQGVTFVSSEKIKTADQEGVKAIYAFTDVNKLTIDQKPNTPGGDAKGGMSVGGDQPELMTFQFSRQPLGSSLLTVRFPEPKFDDKPDVEKPASKQPTPEELQGLQMMKQMFKGLKIGIDVEVDGNIVKTNSPYVSGRRVTLLEMTFDELLDNDPLLAQMQAVKSLEEAKKLLKQMKGFKISLDREVQVEFR